MKILAIDTSARVATAALCDDVKPIALYTLNAGLTHSATMLPMIHHLLEDTGVRLDEIELFAASTGPGSFTGIRIGVSCIKGLAFGKDKPCVGVSTLEAMALSVAPLAFDALICPVMDARRGQVYHAIFEIHGGAASRVTEDAVGDAKSLAKALENMMRPVVFIGDGAGIMEAMKLPCVMTISENLKLQSGYGVALAALRTYNTTKDHAFFTDLNLIPHYLRPSQAEREANDRDNK